MRCEEVEHEIPEYLAGALPADSLLAEHLKTCARCRSEVRELGGTWADLDDVHVPKCEAVMGNALAAELAQLKDFPNIPTGRTPMLYLAKPVLVIAMTLGAALFVGRSLMEATSAHYRGSVSAAVTLVEYGDYQCPPCASYNVTIKDMVARYGDKVRLEYRHFPLLPVHPNATPAAIAAEAAGEQGQYWKMNDLLFESQQRWARAADPEKEFAAMAAELGLDRDRFVKAFKSPELQERVSKDAAAGRALGVVGTPTFFVNGRRIQEAPRTAEDFMKLIEAELRTK